VKQLENGPLGLDQGVIALFSDCENGGEMWTGTGPRERRRPVLFAGTFLRPPLVHLSLALWDLDIGANPRGELFAEHVTERGFDAVFRTWGDTRVARLRAAWLAMGAMEDPDIWRLS